MSADGSEFNADQPEAPPVSPVVDEPIDEKKEKKRKKKEEKRRRALIERFSQPVVATVAEAVPDDRMASFLEPSLRALQAQLALLAQRAGGLIAANAFILSVAFFSMYSALAASQPWWALAPLALTGTLSTCFALLGARGASGAMSLVELCAQPDEVYQASLRDLAAHPEKRVATLTFEVHAMGLEIHRRSAHLRTAINVLLGGLPMSVAALTLCFIFATR